MRLLRFGAVGVTVFAVAAMWVRFVDEANSTVGEGRTIFAARFVIQALVTAAAAGLVFLLLRGQLASREPLDTDAPTPPERFPRISPADAGDAPGDDAGDASRGPE